MREIKDFFRVMHVCYLVFTFSELLSVLGPKVLSPLATIEGVGGKYLITEIV
jgi:hypothetical protein